MGGLLGELAKKLAERWLSLLVLPGALALATLVTADTLGPGHPFGIGRVIRRVDGWSTSWRGEGAASGAVVLLAVLLAAAAVGLIAEAAGSLIGTVWFAEGWESWPNRPYHLARRMTERRRRRWDTAEGERKRARESQDPAGDENLESRRAAAVLARIAPERPGRPTWAGDQIHAVVARLRREFRLDLPTAWPTLWLTMPDTTRSEITEAHTAFERAATLAGWGVIYLAAGVLWWPAAFVAVAILCTAWRRGRTSAALYAQVVEAAARLYLAPLAAALGIDRTGPMEERTGWAVTCLLQGEPGMIAITTGWPERPARALGSPGGNDVATRREETP